MKRAIALCLTVALIILSLTGCNKEGSSSKPGKQNKSEASVSENAPTQETSSSSSESSEAVTDDRTAMLEGADSTTDVIDIAQIPPADLVEMYELLNSTIADIKNGDVEGLAAKTPDYAIGLTKESLQRIAELSDLENYPGAENCDSVITLSQKKDPPRRSYIIKSYWGTEELEIAIESKDGGAFKLGRVGNIHSGVISIPTDTLYINGEPMKDLMREPEVVDMANGLVTKQEVVEYIDYFEYEGLIYYILPLGIEVDGEVIAYQYFGSGACSLTLFKGSKAYDKFNNLADGPGGQLFMSPRSVAWNSKTSAYENYATVELSNGLVDNKDVMLLMVIPAEENGAGKDREYYISYEDGTLKEISISDYKDYSYAQYAVLQKAKLAAQK